MNDYQKLLIRLEIIMPGIRESDRGVLAKHFETRDRLAIGDAFISALDKVLYRDHERRKEDK